VIVAVAPGLSISPQVRHFVFEVLAWNFSLAQAEVASSRSLPSTILGTLTALELGCVGDGCDGTKPLGYTSVDPELRRKFAPEPLGTLRYQRLTGPDLQTADAIVTDGKGLELADVPFGKRAIACTLAQRIAFCVAEQSDPKRYQRWCGKIAAKDSTPALIDAEAFGSECLQSAAKAWFAVG